MPYRIVIDTKEKQPLDFKPYKECEGVICKSLKTGDYSIEGMEDFVCIERKASTVEIARNLGLDSARFYRELERMKDFEYKFIVCEFTMDQMIDYPKGSKVPKYALDKLKFNGKFLLKQMLEISMDYDVHIIYAGSRQSSYTTIGSILRRIWLKHGQSE